MSSVEPEVRDRVYRYLRQSIVTGNIRAGSRLVEDVISKELEVSRTPVREALQRLTSDGLVVRIRRGHVEVRHVTQEERNQLHQLRVAFDEVAGKLLAAKALSIDWDGLYQLLDPIATAQKTHGLTSSDLAIAHMDLHVAINRAAFDANVAALILSQSFLYIIDPHVQPADYDPVTQHRLLLDDLHSGKVRRVVAALRDHAVLKVAD
jgi:DNA-binding GntR family transcriptional regulator